MVKRRSALDRGFTVMEVMVAITILNVFVALIARTILGHDQIVRGYEAWCVDDPVFEVVQSGDALERAIGLPAALDAPSPGLVSRATGDSGLRGPFEVEVAASTPDLAREEWVLVVRQVARGKGHDDDHGEGDDDHDEDDDDHGKGDDDHGPGHGGRGGHR